ncbi:hypothetical protein SprV_0602086000 [Sparganum proliferum]
MKDRLDAEEQSGVACPTPCRDCPHHYTEQTRRRLSSRITDPLFQVATYILEEGDEFNSVGTRTMAWASNKTGRELLEAWVSDTNSINRHVDIPPAITRSVHPAQRRGQILSQRFTQSRRLTTVWTQLIANTTPCTPIPPPFIA